MKKGCIVIFLLLLILLSSCEKEIKIKEINDVSEFDELIKEEGVLKYDIRLTSECEVGHIEYFMCMGPETLEEGYSKVASNIMVLYPNKSKKIVLIGDDEIVLEILNALRNNQYKNLYYYKGGYEKYVADKGDDFVPSVGCDC